MHHLHMQRVCCVCRLCRMIPSYGCTNGLASPLSSPICKKGGQLASSGTQQGCLSALPITNSRCIFGLLYAWTTWMHASVPLVADTTCPFNQSCLYVLPIISSRCITSLPCILPFHWSLVQLAHSTGHWCNLPIPLVIGTSCPFHWSLVQLALQSELPERFANHRCISSLRCTG